MSAILNLTTKIRDQPAIHYLIYLKSSYISHQSMCIDFYSQFVAELGVEPFSSPFRN